MYHMMNTAMGLGLTSTTDTLKGMSEENEFRKTAAVSGSEVSEASESDSVVQRVSSADAGFALLEPREQLKILLHEHMENKPFSELSAVTFDHRGASLIGHLLLDTLEEQGYSIDDYDAVGALTAASVPIVCSLMQAAASRGEALDGFVMDFVYPATKGPSIEGKRVILIDAWLSQKSYVQTSSLVTLRNGNELSLDFGIVDAQGAQVVAVASLIGGIDDGVLRVVDPVTGDGHDVPFVEVFPEAELH